MSKAVELAEVWRGGILESVHSGHVVVCDDTGQITNAWGVPETVYFPRSSCKMVQALPLIESGAARRFGLGQAQLALACASHQGTLAHTDRVKAWLDDLGLGDDDFRCGRQMPFDEATRDDLIRAGKPACQIHNNCSGKHAGFLTLNKHLGHGPDYEKPDHPIQIAIKTAFEEVLDETSPGYGIDGCSAPNHACTVEGMAYAMGQFAGAGARSGARDAAMVELIAAMTAFPEMVNGEGRACTELMRACNGKVAIKGGAEATYVAILPELKRGVALKVTDGGKRGSECAIASVLVKLGALDANHPVAQKYRNPPITNWRGLVTGEIRPAAAMQ